MRRRPRFLRTFNDEAALRTMSAAAKANSAYASRAAGAMLDLDVREGATGGASDGNFTAAVGTPTLDGLGAIGDGAHARHEHVDIASLPSRVALAAALLVSLDTSTQASAT